MKSSSTISVLVLNNVSRRSNRLLFINVGVYSLYLETTFPEAPIISRHI